MTPSQNVEPDWNALRALGREVVDLARNRDRTVTEQKIDPAFAMPGGNWDIKKADFFNGYRRMATLSPLRLQYLRQRSQSFTGYSLIRLEGAANTHCMEPIPNYDAKLPEDPFPEVLTWWTLLKASTPSHRLYKPRAVLGEVGWMVGENEDVLLNHDTCVYQERLSLLHAIGILDALPERARVIEIGGGYGALCCALMDTRPDLEYWIVDIPEALLFSGLYVSASGHDVHVLENHGPGTVTLWPNYLFDMIAPQFSLAIATVTLSQLTRSQIERYVAGLVTLLGKGGVLFEQSYDNRAAGMETCKDVVPLHFQHNRKLDGHFPITQGIPELWCNT